MPEQGNQLVYVGGLADPKEVRKQRAAKAAQNKAGESGEAVT